MTLPKSIESHQKIIAAKISPVCSVTVVVPVRNEAEHLARCLNALSNQIDRHNRPLDPNLYEIVVFINNCTDESGNIARRWKRDNANLHTHIIETNLPPEQSNIGFVRRLLMNEAYLRLIENKHRSGVIMTTDGDTRVASDWIAANLEEIKKGACAVGGRILIDAAEQRKMDGNARRFHLQDTGYRLFAAEIEARLDHLPHDHLPRHHQHFNGSFAVTTNAFASAGGVPSVKFLEDVALYQSLLRVDAPFRHSPFVRVKTSSRHAGRAELGLSSQIKEWTTMGANDDVYLVESAASIVSRARNQAILRALRQTKNQTAFPGAKLTVLAEKLLIPADYLQNELEIPQTFGSLLEKIYCEQQKIGDWRKSYPLTDVEKAIFDLRQMLANLRSEDEIAPQSFSQTSSR